MFVNSDISRCWLLLQSDFHTCFPESKELAACDHSEKCDCLISSVAIRNTVPARAGTAIAQSMEMLIRYHYTDAYERTKVTQSTLVLGLENWRVIV